jgi:hypothetical protein
VAGAGTPARLRRPPPAGRRPGQSAPGDRPRPSATALSHEMHTAPLPRRSAQHRRNRPLQPLVRIRRDQAHAPSYRAASLEALRATVCGICHTGPCRPVGPLLTAAFREPPSVASLRCDLSGAQIWAHSDAESGDFGRMTAEFARRKRARSLTVFVRLGRIFEASGRGDWIRTHLRQGSGGQASDPLRPRQGTCLDRSAPWRPEHPEVMIA